MELLTGLSLSKGLESQRGPGALTHSAEKLSTVLEC